MWDPGKNIMTYMSIADIVKPLIHNSIVSVNYAPKSIVPVSYIIGRVYLMCAYKYVTNDNTSMQLVS